MKKNKFNKKSLTEEIKRFKQINEYDFYIGDEDADENNELLDEDDDDDVTDDLPADDSETNNNDISDLEDTDVIDDLEGLDNEEGLDDEEGLEGLGDEGDFSEESGEDEVELDITELVNGTEEAKQSADEANNKLNHLMDTLDQLDKKMDSMNSITAKIDNLENELEKRAPTPEEKLEMRSLDSYPYNLKLTDFWSEKEGQYDIMGVNDKKVDNEELTLTQNDVNSDYNESSVRNSFNDNDEFEEEDIN